MCLSARASVKEYIVCRMALKAWRMHPYRSIICRQAFSVGQCVHLAQGLDGLDVKAGVVDVCNDLLVAGLAQAVLLDQLGQLGPEAQQ